MLAREKWMGINISQVSLLVHGRPKDIRAVYGAGVRSSRKGDGVGRSDCEVFSQPPQRRVISLSDFLWILAAG